MACVFSLLLLIDAGAPTWPAYAEGAENMRFQGGGSSAEKDDYRKEGIQFLLDNYFPNQGARV